MDAPSLPLLSILAFGLPAYCAWRVFRQLARRKAPTESRDG